MTGAHSTAPRRSAPLDTAAGGPWQQRLVGVDAARGIALVGMMAVHALFAYDSAGDPTLVFSLSTGRSAALFAVLAGVGIAFVTGRERVHGARETRATTGALVGRALVVGAIGLALGYTDAGIAAVILPYYAVLFALAIPLVFLDIRALLATGAVVAVGMPVLGHLVRDALPTPRLTNPSFGYLVDDPFGLLAELALTGYYPALPWIAYLCAGIALGRLELHSARVAGWLLGAGTALAVAASGVSGLLLGPLGGLAAIRAAGTGTAVPVGEVLAFGGAGVAPTTSWWWLAVDAAHTATPLDLLHTIGVAVALLGALLLLGHAIARAAGPVRRALVAVLAPLAAAGSMVLTLYTAHVVFLNSPLDTFAPLPGYVVQVAAALLFALAWRQAVGRGPLESVVSWASHRTQAAMTRSGPAT